MESMTVQEIEAAVRKGEVRATEITQAFLRRIEADDPRLHAFLAVDAERALARAKAIDDKRARGDALGPLAGVPIAIKDAICTRGLPHHRRLEDPRAATCRPTTPR